jgi:hypothetical protein
MPTRVDGFRAIPVNSGAWAIGGNASGATTPNGGKA